MALSSSSPFALVHARRSIEVAPRQLRLGPARRVPSQSKRLWTAIVEATAQGQRRGGPGGESRRHAGSSNVQPFVNAALVAALGVTLAFTGVGTAQARPEGVNRPDLLPKNFTPVIDAAGFLSAGQEVRIIKEVANLEEETGFKLRVLAQNYPNTPGLAIKDFWKVDENTIVFVADPSLGGNILNFNVGAAVDLNVPRSFWTRLAGKYGNIFYWQEKGEDASIEAAVSAIGTCLREPPGPRACSSID